MTESAGPFQKRILFSILFPVLTVGAIICIVSTSLIIPPILDDMRTRIDAELEHVSNRSLEVCESHLVYLLDLRLEDDQEIDDALSREAAEQIKAIAGEFKDIQLMVVNGRGAVVADSEEFTEGDRTIVLDPATRNSIETLEFWGRPVRAYKQYFPFWDWYVVGYIHETAYQEPLKRAKRAIYIGTFGVLVAIWVVLFLVANRLIRTPLKRLGDAARSVANGDLSPLPTMRQDEIGRVVASFNSMVTSLESKDREVADLISALQDSEQRYRDLFERAAEGILVVSVAERRFRYANPAICRMMGYSQTDLAMMTVGEFHPADDAAEITESFDAIARDEIRHVLTDIPCLRSDGEIIYTDIKAATATFDGIPCILAFLTDTTARRATAFEKRDLEKRLQVSEKMEAIGLLAGGVAHDLNNILSGLTSYPELLLMDLPEESPLRAPLLTIESAGWRAAAIVQDLLTLARRGVAVSSVTNLNHIVTAYIRSPEHEKLIEHHPNAIIEVALCDDPINVKGSPVHLSKTIMNLVSNAAEAVGPEGGRITVATRNQNVSRPIKGYVEVQEGDYSVVTVIDDGVGIAPQDLKRIFEPFYSRKVMGRSGTGLGMAVVWGTVKDHDGYIDVVSTQNQGTTFTLYFPVTREMDEAESESLSLDDLQGNGETILVVDDVPEQREIASRILARLGYEVYAVASGEEAIDYLQKHSVDLAILDMIMDTGMDGLDTFNEILQFKPTQKALIASGFSECDRVREARRLGAHQYIKKPYTLGSIGRAVAAALHPDSDGY
jgi:two-component system, cell cycle sensor histidine kinase and response regulator CckA